MGDQNQATTSSRLGMRSVAGGGGGEIVEVQGGHIVRSTGRKDRHSKVCTAKGPRDRRVRLSAHTAIQFYDVQDRLGYDRPSKAVDWLIKKAKAAIDELDELPAWNPISTSSDQQQQQQQLNENTPPADALASGSRRASMVADGSVNLQHHMADGGGSAFLPPSLDSDAIADTIKSFFPIAATAEDHSHSHPPPPPSSSIQFHQTYPPDLLSRTSSHSQDLRLSLQSLHDPILLHHQAQAHQNEQALFSGTASPMGFGWSEHHHHHHQNPAEMSRFHRLVAWNGGDTGNAGNDGGSGEGGGFIFNSPPPLQPLFGRNQFFSQRGPLQSSNTPSVRTWIDPSSIAAATDDHHQSYQAIHQSTMSSSAAMAMGFASGGFSGFNIPARIQGEEEHDGISDKPSSASSDSRH